MKSILQTPEWANFKKSQGFEILRLGKLFIHKKKMPLGQSFLYLPEVSAKDINAQQIDELKKLTKEQKSIFTRLELLDKFRQNSDKLVLHFGFSKSFEEVQPKWRQMSDLSKTRETILSEMKQKGRYNVKLAGRRQVEVKSEKLKVKSKDSEEKTKIIRTFYALYKQTNEREHLAGRSLEYFQNLVDNFADSDYLKIYIASYQGEPICTALVGFCGGVASYLYGGSSRRHREVMAPYLMHWKVILDAKEKGCKLYDLLGRAAPGDEKSKWQGVTRFKEQFGGEAVEVLGSYDFVAKPLWYTLFKTVEKIRRPGE